MIRVTVNYPSGDGTTFDHDYYANSHVPLAVEAWGPVRTEIDKGVNGPYVASVHFYFDSLEAFQGAMGSEKTAAVQADVTNYTNIAPILQVSEIVG
ncbi:MAG: EthD family reductase [Acidimicrobiales bacterium]|nr:EthD family reductase [Acidimicrobiales bacterium]